MKTCLIVANGPSLADVPNAFLTKYDSFGCNRVFLKEGFQSTYMTVVDPKMVWTPELCLDLIPSLEGAQHAFLSDEAAKRVRKLYVDHWLPANFTTLIWKNYYGPDGRLLIAFSGDPLQGVVSGGTVTYVNLQLASWMGYQRVLLVGLDHTFVGKRGDHFSPEYNRPVGIPYRFEPPKQWAHEHGKWYFSEREFVTKVEPFYLAAAQHFMDRGGEIINCTPETKLRILPVDTWENW